MAHELKQHKAWALDCARVQLRELRQWANKTSVPYDWDTTMSNAFDQWYPAYCASRMSTMYQCAQMAGLTQGIDSIVLESTAAWNEIVFLLGDYVPRRYAQQLAAKGNKP